MKCRSVTRARRCLAGVAHPEHVADRRSVVRRRCGHHRVVCDVRIGARRHHQQKGASRDRPQALRGCWLVGRLNPSSRTDRPPGVSGAVTFAHSETLYITRSTEPRRTDSTANRSGSSLARSSPRGHHAPSTCPVIRALGFRRSRGMFSGPARWPPKTARSACWSSPRSDRLADVGGSSRAAIVLSHLHLGVAILLARSAAA